MSAEWFMLLTTSLFGIISYYLPKPLNDLKKYNYQSTRFIFAILIFSVIIIVTGLRTVYGDTVTYVQTFDSLSTDFSELYDGLVLFSDDGSFFWFLSGLFKGYISADSTIWLITISAISCFCVMYVLYKKSEDFPLSCFLFMTMGYYAWLMNGMRQYLAVCLLFACVDFILKKKYFILIFVFLLALFIHQSSIVFIPALFFINIKSPWNKKVLFFVGCVLLCVYFADTFTEIFVDVTDSDEEIASAGGSSIWWAVVSVVPCIIAFIKRKKIEQYNNTLINFSIIMSIFTVSFYLLAVFTSGIYIGRIPVFFSMYNLLLLPWLIKNCFEDKERAFLYFLCVLGYLYFFYVNVSSYYSEYLNFLY